MSSPFYVQSEKDSFLKVAKVKKSKGWYLIGLIRA